MAKIQIAPLMRQFQCDLPALTYNRSTLLKNQYLSRDLNAAIPLRSARTEVQNTIQRQQRRKITSRNRRQSGDPKLSRKRTNFSPQRNLRSPKQTHNSETNGFENETGIIGLRPAVFWGSKRRYFTVQTAIFSIPSLFDSVFCKPQMTTETLMMLVTLVYSATLHVRQTNIWPLAKEKPNEKHVFAMGFVRSSLIALAFVRGSLIFSKGGTSIDCIS